MPEVVHRTIDGSSSNCAERLAIGPPAAGIVAMRRLVKKNFGLAIEVSNAICEPSGDHCGLLSGPSPVTSLRSAPSDTATTEMSAEPLFAGSPLMRWSNAICRLSGDQSNRPTVNAPLVSRRIFFVSTSTTWRCDIRWSSSMTSNSAYFFSRSLSASDRGSLDANAIDRPSGDQANAPTDSSADVSFSASPPPRSIR